MAKGDLKVYLTANTKKFERAMRRVQYKLNNFSKKVAKVSLVAGAALTAMGIKAIKAASDMEETESKFNVVFSKMKKDGDKMAENLVDNFGLSGKAAKQLLGDTGDLLTGFGFGQKEALKLSNEVNKLAVDLASFTNFSGGAAGASKALTKALLGERESLKSLGISILDKDVKERVAINTAKKMTFGTERQAKAFATLQLAQEQSKNAIGDFERTQDSFANKWRVLQSRIEDFKVELGKLLIPLLDVASGTGDITNGIKKMTTYIKDHAKEWKVSFKLIGIVLDNWAQKVYHQLSWYTDNWAEVFRWIGENFTKLAKNTLIILTAWNLDVLTSVGILMAYVTRMVQESVKALFAYIASGGTKDVFKPLSDLFVENMEKALKRTGLLTKAAIKNADFSKIYIKNGAYLKKLWALSDKEMEEKLKKLGSESADKPEGSSFEKVSPMTDFINAQKNNLFKGLDFFSGEKTKTSPVQEKTKFAGALEKGSIEAYRAELANKKSPANQTAQNTKDSVEIQREMLKEQKRTNVLIVKPTVGFQEYAF